MDSEDLIRQLIEETSQLPRHELPGMWDWAKGHPGILTSRTKSPERYDADMRRAHFLEQAEKRARDQFLSSPSMLRASTPDEIRKLRSPYQPYGADSPLSNAGRWAGSLPAAVYATGQMLANEVDPEVTHYPDAYDDFAKSINNFVVVAEPMGVNKNHMRDMQEMRAEQDSLPWHSSIPRQDWDDIVNQEYALRAETKDGRQYLAEAGLTGPGAQALGLLMDATVDPLMTPSRTWGGLALDYGLGTAHGTVPAAIGAVGAMRGWGDGKASPR